MLYVFGLYVLSSLWQTQSVLHLLQKCFGHIPFLTGFFVTASEAVSSPDFPGYFAGTDPLGYTECVEKCPAIRGAGNHVPDGPGTQILYGT